MLVDKAVYKLEQLLAEWFLKTWVYRKASFSYCCFYVYYIFFFLPPPKKVKHSLQLARLLAQLTSLFVRWALRNLVASLRKWQQIIFAKWNWVLSQFAWDKVWSFYAWVSWKKLPLTLVFWFFLFVCFTAKVFYPNSCGGHWETGGCVVLW